MNQKFLVIFSAWIVFISVLTTAVTVADKIRATKGRFRISEKTLFILALSGGSLAEYVTMKLIRHKTLHKRFMLGLPLIIIFQFVSIMLVFYKLYST